MNKKMKSFGKTVRNLAVRGMVSTVKSTCGTSHLLLKYGIGAVETIEAESLHRLIGVDQADVRKERHIETVAIQLKVMQIFDDVKSGIPRVTKHRFGTEEAVVVETIEHAG